MSAAHGTYPFLDVQSLPPQQVRVSAGAVRVAVSFRASWADGFGARGWKLDANLDDPEIIAATSRPGDAIPTSVPVHDLMDHLLCGFAASGHRAEAMALAQLAPRTDSDPTPDYRQMVLEDLLPGNVIGESAYRFIGPALRRHLPPTATDWDGPRVMAALHARLGEALLTELLVARMCALGHAGRPHALLAWQRTGLDYRDRGRLGHQLQRLFEDMDAWVQAQGCHAAHGEIRIRADACEFANAAGCHLRR